MIQSSTVGNSSTSMRIPSTSYPKVREVILMQGYSSGRFELRTISPHFGQTVVGIYKTIEEAQEAKQLKMRSQALPVVIYDSHNDQPVR